jgi:hypothetical protein
LRGVSFFVTGTIDTAMPGSPEAEGPIFIEGHKGLSFSKCRGVKASVNKIPDEGSTAGRVRQISVTAVKRLTKECLDEFVRKKSIAMLRGEGIGRILHRAAISFFYHSKSTGLWNEGVSFNSVFRCVKSLKKP